MKTISCIILGIWLPLWAGLGDLNSDGRITIDDCTMIARAVATGTVAGQPAAADVDGDGTVSICDAMRLHQYIDGLWTDPSGTLVPNPQISPSEAAYLARYEELGAFFENLSPSQFIDRYPPAPAFASLIDPRKCRYFDRIDSVYKLTDNQKNALATSGMVVLPAASTTAGFGSAYATVFKKDLPVLVTADALLDPLYKSYDNILKTVEVNKLCLVMDTVLRKTIAQLEQMKNLHGQDAAWKTPLLDVEVYLSVARALLDNSSTVTADPEVKEVADSLLSAIADLQLKSTDFFGIADHAIDFSQFKPRAHYEVSSSNPPKLSYYFKCMMWLGRADCGFVIDSLRHLRDFALLHDCIEKAGAMDLLIDFNRIVTFFVGDVDGFSVEGLSRFYQETTDRPTIERIIESDSAAAAFRQKLRLKGCGNQFILSQALWKDPDAFRPELPRVAQLSGQRFIIDSYLLGHTVEWYVDNRNKPFLEEVAFCLGNNAAIDILKPDLGAYVFAGGDYKPYHVRLGAARTLFDLYPYWDKNLYTLWLDALRSLSTPLPATIPPVMRSRTWQDKQMNTQLASWAQLRHNTLLYAKQSYTGGEVCFYPDGYVEPYPAFYRKIGAIMDALGQSGFASPGKNASFYLNWKAVTDTLALIAENELRGTPLSAEQLAFINRMLVTKSTGMCGEAPFSGWYPQLFWSTEDPWWECSTAKPCIADVHTIPPSIVKPDDMVLHAATGAAHPMLLLVADNDTCGTLYAGAVSSFYQYDVTPIARKTDSEWETLLKSGSVMQPAWFERYKAK